MKRTDIYMSKDGKGEKYEIDVKNALSKVDGIRSNKDVQESHPNTGDGGVDWKGTNDKGKVKDAIDQIKKKGGKK